MVRVTRGEVYDVAVDMRQGSKTLGKWVGVFLSEENQRQLWIPPGFAHGFLVTRGPADFLYKSTDYYNSAAECAVRWNDREINISWPIDTGMTPILSERDRIAQSFFDSPKIL